MKTTRVALIYLLSSWACPEGTASQVIGTPRRNRNGMGDDTARTGSRVNRHLNQPGTPARLFHKQKMHLRGATLLDLIEEDEAEAEVAAELSMSMSTKMGEFGDALVEPTIAAFEEPETTTISAVGVSEPTTTVPDDLIVIVAETSPPTSAPSSAPSSSPSSAPSSSPTSAPSSAPSSSKAGKPSSSPTSALLPSENIAAIVGDVPEIVTHSIVIDEIAGNGGKPSATARENDIAGDMGTEPSAKASKKRRRARIRNM